MRCIRPGIAAVPLAAWLLTALPALPAGASMHASSVSLQRGAEIQELAPGKFLVARRGIPDPNFAEAVILLVHYDKKNAMGLIVNRATDIPVSRVLKELEMAKGRQDPVYLGGPVGRTGVLALLRSKTKPEEGRHVFADVYLVSSGKALEKAVTAGTEPAALRVYLGYSGWAAGQLEHEVERGMWHVLKADSDTVFDSEPDSVWLRMIQRTELRRAFAPPAIRTD